MFKDFNWEEGVTKPQFGTPDWLTKIQFSHPIRDCRHWRQPVAVGPYTITCSGNYAGKATEPPYPDFGVYLAQAWRTDLAGSMTANGCTIKRLLNRSPYRAIFVDWVDGSVVSLEVLDDLVEIILSKLRHSQKVDIGCMAAHGRTGTLLASLIASAEHMDGKAALKTMRERYCKYAVEYKAQEELIEDYAGMVQRRQRRINGRQGN